MAALACGCARHPVEVESPTKVPPDADQTTWLTKHPDGRRDGAMRVGTLLMDRASRASGMSPSDLVLVPSDEVLRLAGAL